MTDAERHVNRGRVGVSVDGGAPQVVDTYAAPAQHRTIVWQGTWAPGRIR